MVDISVKSPDSEIKCTHEGGSPKEIGMLEFENFMNVLTKVDLDLAFFSEKLVNLHVVLMNLLAQENDLETMTAGNNYISADFLEKALVFNLLSGIFDSEVRELDSFIDSLEAEIFDARQKMSSCRHLRETCTTMEEKLHDSEESLKQSQHQISEVKLQSAKLQRTVLAFTHDNCKLAFSSRLVRSFSFTENLLYLFLLFT